MAKNSSEGGFVEGLGWFDAEVVKFGVHDKRRFKIPHMGWNNASINRAHKVLEGLSNDSMYYFVHSYYMNCNDQRDVLTTTCYEEKFVSAIQKDNVYGTQFHPEKSHNSGERFLRNFLELL